MVVDRLSAWARDASRYSPLLLALGAFGYALRIALWAVSDGSNDIQTWYYFALTIDGFGLAETHVLQPLYNHPPLMGWMSVAALHISKALSAPFAMVFKFPSLVAELLIGLLLFRVYRDRGSKVLASAAFAAYGLSLSCILISGFHGNTDAIYFFLAFLAAFAMERGAPFWAGLALGAALNVKLIPILLGLPLATRCTNLREFGRYALGASIGAIPFLWELAVFDTEQRAAFIRNLFMYRSNLEYWGVESMVRWAVSYTHTWLPGFADAVRHFGNWYSLAGGKLLLMGSAVLAAAHLYASRKLGPQRRLFDSYELATLGFALFLFFGSGFGLQYVGCIVAPLAACGVLRSVFVSTTSGLFLIVTYVSFVVTWYPIASNHVPIPASFSPLSNLAWFAIGYVSYAVIRDARARTRGASTPAERPISASSEPAPPASSTRSLGAK